MVRDLAMFSLFQHSFQMTNGLLLFLIDFKLYIRNEKSLKNRGIMLKDYAKLIGLLAVLIISIIDYIIVIDISLSILYLLPISLAIWYGTRWFSLLLVLISTVGWFIAEFAAKTNGCGSFRTTLSSLGKTPG